MARDGYQSEGTTEFTSSVSFWGENNALFGLSVASALTASRITATSLWGSSVTGVRFEASGAGSRFSGAFLAPAGSAVTPTFAFSSALSVGMYAVSTKTVGFVGGVDFFTNANILSIATGTTGSGLTIGQLQLLHQASGFSLVYSSGKSLYVVAASATSGVQP